MAKPTNRQKPAARKTLAAIKPVMVASQMLDAAHERGRNEGYGLGYEDGYSIGRNDGYSAVLAAQLDACKPDPAPPPPKPHWLRALLPWGKA